MFGRDRSYEPQTAAVQALVLSALKRINTLDTHQVLQAGAGRYESEYPHETLSAALKCGYCFVYEILL
jgi:hypothetical protein